MNRPFSPVQIYNSFLKIIPYIGVTFAVVLGTVCLALLLAVIPLYFVTCNRTAIALTVAFPLLSWDTL